jgi:hypothetical protein
VSVPWRQNFDTDDSSLIARRWSLVAVRAAVALASGVWMEDTSRKRGGDDEY